MVNKKKSNCHTCDIMLHLQTNVASEQHAYSTAYFKSIFLEN